MKFGPALEAMQLGKKMQLPGAGYALLVESDERSVPVKLVRTDNGEVWEPTHADLLSQNWEVA